MALERLDSHPEFKVAAGSTDIRGWKLIDRDGLRAGRIEGLLFDPAAGVVRYAIADLWDKHVLLPIADIEIDERGQRTMTRSYTRVELHRLVPYEAGDVPAAVDASRREPTACAPAVEDLAAEPMPAPAPAPASGNLIHGITFDFGDVDIERRAVNRPVTGNEGVRVEGDLVIIPIIGEEVIVERRPVVKEELILRKRAKSPSLEAQQRRPADVTFVAMSPDALELSAHRHPPVPAMEPPHGPGRPDDPHG